MSALGEDFKRARESRGLALSEVAGLLHIRSEFLEAIETERWEIIGDPISLRGLLRTYARFLGLDASAMVERFKSEHGGTAETLAAEPPKKSFDVKTFGIVLLGVAAVVVLFFTLTHITERLRAHQLSFSSAAKPSPSTSPTPLNMTLVATPAVPPILTRAPQATASPASPKATRH
jgi:cytoskeletal protein RodZ